MSHIIVDTSEASNSELNFYGEDGLPRWVRGVGRSNFLVATVTDQILVYVSGAHIKYLKVSLELARADVIRIFQPTVAGIGLIEGNPGISAYAIAETTKNPRILIYNYCNSSNSEMQIAVLKGCAKFEYRALRFTKNDLLLVLVGVPEFVVSVWRWASAEELLVISSVQQEIKSDLVVSDALQNYWVEWSPTYLTFYELQTIHENNVIQTEISLPPKRLSTLEPDPRRAAASAIDIISVVWTNNGDLFVLDEENGIYKLKLADKKLIKVGDINFEPNSKVTALYPYGNCVAAETSAGVLLILVVDFDTISLKRKLELCGKIRQFLPYYQNRQLVTNSFYAIIDSDGLLDTVVDGKLRSAVPVTDFTNANIRFASFIEPEANHLASISQEGTITIWDCNTGNLLAKWTLPFLALTIQSHPLIPYLAVGASQGRIFFLDVRDLNNPKILHRGYLSEDGLIDRIAFCARGKLLLSGDTKRGKLFLQYGLPTLNFMYLDHADLPGQIWQINLPSNYRDLRLQVLTKTVDEDVPSYLNNYRLNNDQLDLVASQELDIPLTSLCFSPFNELLCCYSCEEMSIGMIPFSEDPQAGPLKGLESKLSLDFPLDLNRILVVSNCLITFSEDGMIMIHELSPMENSEVVVTRHKIQTHFMGQGGVVNGIVNSSGTKIVAIGRDRTLVHVNLGAESSFDWDRLGLGNDVLDVINAQMKIFANMNVENRIDIDHNELSLEQKEEEEQENFNVRKYFQEIQAVEMGIEDIRNEMQELLKENKKWSHEDQLDIHEFELDSDEDENLDNDYEKDKTIAEITAKSILQEREDWFHRIKAMVWDNFEVKGTRVKGFQFSHEISNYPLPPLSPQRKQDTKYNFQARLFESKVGGLEESIKRMAYSDIHDVAVTVDLGVNLENVPGSRDSSPRMEMETKSCGDTMEEIDVPEDNIDEAEFEWSGETGSIESDDEQDYDMSKFPSMADASSVNTETQDADRINFFRNLCYGSMSCEIIKPNPLLHHQLEISSRYHIRQQMCLIEMEIRRLKEYFNKAFEKTCFIREAEMKIIVDRNERLSEIKNYLRINTDVLDPALSEYKDPDSAFIVRDEEIPFEPYLTEEEREGMEWRQIEEASHQLTTQDDFHQSALEVMMDRVLEPRAEDMLKKDVPQPAFMLTKEKWEWSQEECRLAKEHRRETAEVEELRSKFIKELEAELRTLTRDNMDSKEIIDAHLQELWLLKIRVETCIKMEEIKLCRMIMQIVQRHQMDANVHRMSVMLKKLLDSMKSSKNLASQLLTRIESRTKRCEFVMERKRLLEHTFKKDLGDVGHFFDLFARLYRKRTKFSIGNDGSSEVTTEMVNALGAPSLKGGFVLGCTGGEIVEKIGSSLLELDDPSHIPVGCPRSIWDRFVILRRSRLLCDYEMRAIRTELVQLKQAFSECKIREEEVAATLESALATGSRQKELKMSNIHNFELQLVLNQGQVELPSACTRRDFHGAMLLRKKFVETCNDLITEYGAVKLRTMNHIKDQHRRIKQLEWRFQLATVTKQNLLEKCSDINTIKASKEILHFISQGHSREKLQEARLQKIRDFQVVAENFHKHYMDCQEMLLERIAAKEKETDLKNRKLKGIIFEQKLNVNETSRMYGVEPMNDNKEGYMRRRIKMIMHTGRIMRSIAKNAEEIVLLENELGRQYRRTYPVL